MLRKDCAQSEQKRQMVQKLSRQLFQPRRMMLFAVVCCFQVTAIHAATNITTKRYVVMLKRDTDQDRCVNEHAIQPGRAFRHAINGFVANLNSNAIERLRRDPRVQAITEDKIAASNSGQIIPAGVRRMAVDNFPPVKIDGTDKRVNVDVAVIDSGIQADHLDLNVVQSVVFGYGELVDPGDSHGTACAGIIGALDNDFGVVGVAPGVRLWSIRACSGGKYWQSDIFASFDYVAAHADQIAVVSCSFITFYGKACCQDRYFYEQAMLGMVSKGVVVVAAAGNDAGDIAGPDGNLESDDNCFPAALPEVMAVSGVNVWGETFADYSNFSRTSHNSPCVYSPGAAIDVAGPTDGIATTSLSSGYNSSFTGTSAACPNVAGIVALYIATHGRATNAMGVYAIRQAIVDAALPQSLWTSSNTRDPDPNHEGLAVASLSWATNAPQLLHIIRNGASVQTRFPTLPGYRHSLEYADSPTTNNEWTLLCVTNGTGLDATIDDIATAPQRFYRLATKPNPLLVASNAGTLGKIADGSYFGAASGLGGALPENPINKAAGFNYGVVRIPYLAQLNTNSSFSVEIWLKPAASNSWIASPTPCIVSSHTFERYQASAYRRNGWILYQSDPSNSTGNGFNFRLYNTTGDTAVSAASVNLLLDTNHWYHVVGTYDGSNISLYTNGALASSVSAGGPFRPNLRDPMTIGLRSDGAFSYTGFLDEYAFYTNALSETQVLAHYQAGTNAAPSIPYSQVILNDNPAGYWRFDEQ